ncbi:MAG: hypothetical protein AB7O96_15965 [Pseudobdellovibrionaceae bacterium]
MKTIFALMLMTGSFADAATLYCRSGRFEGQAKTILVSAEVGSNRKLKALEVEIDSDSARKASTVYGRGYNKKNFKNMVLFPLDTNDVEIGIGWEDSRLSLVLPKDFSSKANFKGMIASETSNMEKNNEINCSIQ